CEDCIDHMIFAGLMTCTEDVNVDNWKELINNLETKSYKYNYIMNFSKKVINGDYKLSPKQYCESLKEIPPVAPITKVLSNLSRLPDSPQSKPSTKQLKSSFGSAFNLTETLVKSKNAIPNYLLFEKFTMTSLCIFLSLLLHKIIKYRKKYVCHHSGFQKVPKEENKKGNSKNAMCQAYILCSIKLSTPWTKKTDSYVKLFVHQSVQSTDLWEKWASRFTYSFNFTNNEHCEFSSIICIAPNISDGTSLEQPVHFLILKVSLPIYYYLFVQKKNVEVLTEHNHSYQYTSTNNYIKSTIDVQSNTVEEETLPVIINNDNASQSLQTTASENVSMKNIISLMTDLDEKYCSSTSGLKMIESRLKKITSVGMWESFLHTAGASSVPLRRRSGATIKVQPTSIARRPLALTRGSKRFPAGRPAKQEKIINKRKRNLGQNIQNNFPNAKSHGRGH
ncbi:hypothetical protein ACI65C_009242, partial [Semiaphis heraclei]